LANNCVIAGEVHAAEALVEEERQLSQMTRVAPVGYTNLLLQVYRGEAASVLPMIDAAIDTATNDGQGRIIAFSEHVSAVLYNGLGRHAEALQCARRVVEGDTLGYQTLAAFELAEAASRDGDARVLADLSVWAASRAAATPTEWALGVAALVRALEVGDTDDADELYRQSIEHLGRTRLRVSLARSQLLYGEWLRRRGSKNDARDQLEIAHEALRVMDIRLFASRARRELTATGGRRMSRYLDSPSLQLTSQELQIAQLVQQGFSNKEIGSSLFLSPRTVEWHLRNIFGKTGVSSRRQLRDRNLEPSVLAAAGSADT
jgi:ATP/maltotriose-dependent transcriptional regulator MalT